MNIDCLKPYFIEWIEKSCVLSCPCTNWLTAVVGIVTIPELPIFIWMTSKLTISHEYIAFLFLNISKPGNKWEFSKAILSGHSKAIILTETQTTNESEMYPGTLDDLLQTLFSLVAVGFYFSVEHRELKIPRSCDIQHLTLVCQFSAFVPFCPFRHFIFFIIFSYLHFFIVYLSD